MGVMDLRRRIMLNEPHIVTTTPAGIASFSTDMIAPLKECKVEFLPVQSGSGDPSPSNVRPISGWTGVNVYRAGKNLIDKTKYVSYANAKRFIAYGVNNWSDVTPNGDLELGIGSYTFSFSGDNTVNPVSISVYNSAWERIKIVYNNKIVNFSVTLPGAYAIYINFGDPVPFDSYDVQLEPGSTATPYEPYTGSTIPIDWTAEAGTVYGGYVDLVTGELVAEWGGLTNRWGDARGRTTLGDTQRGLFTCPFTPKAPGYYNTHKSEALNNYGKWSWNYFSDAVHFYYADGNFYMFMPVDTDDDTEIQFVLTLATPITYQLTPTQQKSLRGVNNIWSDANGDTTVKYWTH